MIDNKTIEEQEKELTECIEQIVIQQENIFNNPLKLVFPGGGLKGYYGVGICTTLNKYKLTNNIVGIRGSSSGALNAVSLACNSNIITWWKTYNIFALNYSKQSLLEILMEINTTFLPDNAHILSNDKKVEIIATEITWFGFREKIFTDFPTKEYLTKCLMASCCIPYFTYNKFPYYIEIDGKYYIDGGFLNINPWENKCNYNQLIINYNKITYPLKYWTNPYDKNIHKLIMKGLTDIQLFLNKQIDIDNCSNNNIINIIDKHTIKPCWLICQAIELINMAKTLIKIWIF